MTDNDYLAQCLELLHSDLEEAGLIEKGVAPMFLTEAIINAYNIASAKAWQDGYEDGFDEGYDTAMDDAQLRTEDI